MATEIDDDTLQRYYDGELSPAEERTLRASVENDADAKARLAQLSQLSELLRTACEDMASDLDSDALFAGIEADIAQKGKLGVGERLRVITTEWTEHKKAVVVPLVGAVAVAAAALFMFALPDQGSRGPSVASTTRAPQAESHQATPAARAVPAQAAPAALAVHGSEVEAVDFGSSTGTVFRIDSQGIATAVVWIADEDEESVP